MFVDPSKPGTGQPLGPRLDPTIHNQPARHSEPVRSLPADPPQEADRSQDEVRLSEEARAAARTEGDASPSGISRERLREILKRLTSGYYDNPQVREQIARRLHEAWPADVRID